MASSRHGGGGAKQQPAPAPAPAPAQEEKEFDPTYEWQENAANFLLRLRLPGFRKEDLRVQVDGAGRLTVRGHRQDSRFRKVFQLPVTSNLDGIITGRFEAGVLTITVPKRPGPAIDDNQQPSKPKEDAEDANNKKQAADAEDHDQINKSSSRPQAHHQDHGDGEAKATKEQDDAATNKAAAEPKLNKDDDKAPPAVRKEEGKPTTTTTAPTDKTKPQPHRGQRPAAAAPQERRHCRWQEELEGLAASDWAQGLLDTAKKNKEVIAAAVAAFSLGLFASSRIFSRN